MNSNKYILFSIFLLCIITSCSSEKDSNELEEITSLENSENTEPTGSSAKDLLSEEKFTKLLIELVHIEGHQPTAETLNNFESFLEERLNKSGGIEIRLKEISSPGLASYSIDDIVDLEQKHRESYNSQEQIAVFAFFVDGEYAENTENSSVLGIAYRNTSFVVFEKTIRNFSDTLLAPSLTVLETTVVNHEFAHLLGLVNAGTPLQSNHQDTDHGRHCNVEDCLMYWTAETGEGLINMVSGGTIPTLDAQCLADLKANGGK